MMLTQDQQIQLKFLFKNYLALKNRLRTNYNPSIQERIIELEFANEYDALTKFLKTPDEFARLFKERSKQRSLTINNALNFNVLQKGLTNRLYWKIAIVVFQPQNLYEMLLLLCPNLTHVVSLKCNSPESVLLQLLPLTHLAQSPIPKNLGYFAMHGPYIFSIGELLDKTAAFHQRASTLLYQQYPELAQEIYTHNNSLIALRQRFYPGPLLFKENVIRVFQDKGDDEHRDDAFNVSLKSDITPISFPQSLVEQAVSSIKRQYGADEILILLFNLPISHYKGLLNSNNDLWDLEGNLAKWIKNQVFTAEQAYAIYQAMIASENESWVQLALESESSELIADAEKKLKEWCTTTETTAAPIGSALLYDALRGNWVDQALISQLLTYCFKNHQHYDLFSLAEDSASLHQQILSWLNQASPTIIEKQLGFLSHPSRVVPPFTTAEIAVLLAKLPIERQVLMNNNNVALFNSDYDIQQYADFFQCLFNNLNHEQKITFLATQSDCNDTMSKLCLEVGCLLARSLQRVRMIRNGLKL